MKRTGSKTTAATSAIIYIILLVIALAALIGGCTKGKIWPEEKSKEVAAIVNGASIHFDEVNEEYATLTPVQQANLTKAYALSFVIEREILYQEAIKQGLKASEKELSADYASFLALHNLTEPELKEQLAARNSSLERFKLAHKKQLLINKLLDEKVPSRFIIRHEDVEAFYKASGFSSRGLSFNKSEKAIVELLTAKHLKIERGGYIEGLKSKADVVIVSVPS